MSRMRYKLLALALSLVMGVSSVAIMPLDAQATEKASSGNYPTEWDLTLLYKNEKEWNADYDKADKLLDKVKDYKGKLNTAENIYDYLEFVELGEYYDLYSKMNAYVSYGSSLDASDGTITKLKAKLNVLNAKKNTVTAFAEPEIFQMSLAERKKLFSDPIFKDMTYWLKDYTDPDYKPLTEEELVVLSTLGVAQGYTENAYSVLMNVDIQRPMITMPDGTEKELTDSVYDEIVYSKDYDEEFKAKANELMLVTGKQYANTFATLLEGKMQEAYAEAKINGYDSTMEYAFSDYDMDTKVYDMLIDAAHKGSSDYQRYYDIHKKGLGLDKQYAYHMAESVADYYPEKVKYDDAMNEVMDSLNVLGTDYMDVFKKILTSGHIDVYPKDTKESGAYMDNRYIKDLPWVLYNYNDLSSGISTLAHEMGHACYGELSAENQPVQYASPTIFTHEVASMTNEILYNTYKINNAKTDDEKLYYLEAFIKMYSSSFFGQMMFAEFEDYAYKKVEAGEGLDAEDLSDKYMELIKKYRADGVVTFPDAKYNWTEVPHFYYVYYVYQYSADIVYATSIAGRILDEEEGAAQEYIEFLKLGNSDTPVNLLKKAGVNPLDKETYDYALNYYKKLIDEYEKLTKAKK